MIWVKKWALIKGLRGPQTSICLKNTSSYNGWCCNLDFYTSVTHFYPPPCVLLTSHVTACHLDARYNDDDPQGQMFHIQMRRAISLAQKSWMTTSRVMYHLVGWVGGEKFLRIYRYVDVRRMERTCTQTKAKHKLWIYINAERKREREREREIQI